MGAWCSLYALPAGSTCQEAQGPGSLVCGTPSALKNTRKGSFVLYAYAADIAAAPSLVAITALRMLWQGLIGGRLAANDGWDFRGSTAEDSSVCRGKSWWSAFFFCSLFSLSFFPNSPAFKKPAAPEVHSSFSFVRKRETGICVRQHVEGLQRHLWIPC